MSERKTIEKLHKENTDFTNERMARNLANSLDSLSTDIFTEYIRFLFELIQNADDAGATEVVINLQKKHLVLAHNGKAFSPEDVEALCSIGEGTKQADQTKTGYKGIGFKSVFGKSKHVAVFSQGFQFKFTSEYQHPQFTNARMPWQIIPVWAERKDYPEGVFALPTEVDWNVVTVIAMNSTDQLQKDLEELIGNGEVLLFLRQLMTIRIVGSMDLTISRMVQAGTEAFKEVTIRKDADVTSEWITHSFENIPIDPRVQEELRQDKKTPKKLQVAEHAQISFAARIHKGKVTPLKADESLIYTYLPTKVNDFQFPFLLNSSFLTNAGREELHDDQRWNEWLMEQAGMKLLDWLAMLAKTKSYADHVLFLLPKNSLLGGNLARVFHSAFTKHAKDTPFVPSRTDALLKAQETLVDQTGLSETTFITAGAVVEYFNSTTGKTLGPDSFIRSSVSRPEALRSLNAQYLELDDLAIFFSHDIFRKHHEPEQNYDLIKYFHTKANGNREWTQRLRAIPFVYAKGKMLRPPAALCFPTMEYKNEFGEGVSVLHKVVYSAVEKDPGVREWLKSIGVKEPSDDAYLENEIIGNISSCVTKDNYLKVARFLFEKGKRGELSGNHFQALHSIKLMTTAGILMEAQYCFLSDTYEPRLKLESVHDAGQYVATDYIQYGELASDWKSFLLRLGVSERITVIEAKARRYSGLDSIPAPYWDEVHADAKQQAKNRNYHPDLVDGRNNVELSRITFAEYAHEHSFAKIFWENVIVDINPANIATEAQLHWGFYGSTWPVQNYIKWSFLHEAIFPATTGECLVATSVINNLPELAIIGGIVLPVFDCAVVMKDNWLKLIPLRTTLELEDYLTVLEHLAALEEKESNRQLDYRRIGLIYSKMAAEVVAYSSEKREQLRAWSNKNKLLASDGTFALASELKWLKMDGAKVPKGLFRTLLVPDNCTTDGNFELLLKGLGIEIIEKVSVQAPGKREDEALKSRLKALVPFLALVASVKQHKNFNVVLEQLARRIERIMLYQCSSVSLVFKSAGGNVPGESMQCYGAGSTIYYAGDWFSKSTIYELVPALAKALSVPKLDMDLMRLLHSNLNEIEAFMDELGVDVADLPDDVKQFTLVELMSDDEDEEDIPVSSKNHLAQSAKNEANQEARKLVLARLKELGFDTTGVNDQNSVVNGVRKDGKKYPLVIKSYRNTSFKFNIRPNEWEQLEKENAMFWVHRGGGELVVLQLDDLLAANKEFHVQFETKQFGRDGMAKFAQAFRYMKNVHFQLDSPLFRMADAFTEYRFNVRTDEKLDKGDDSDTLLH